ncbi:MAG: hypothetical protein WAY38_08050 [Gemmiger qucibialis]
MLDNTQSIICAFGLAAAAPRSPYRHLELCGIALGIHLALAKSLSFSLFSDVPWTQNCKQCNVKNRSL